MMKSHADIKYYLACHSPHDEARARLRDIIDKFVRTK